MRMLSGGVKLTTFGDTCLRSSPYNCHGFLLEIISHSVWFYYWRTTTCAC